jgi:signal transduction histidine kinase
MLVSAIWLWPAIFNVVNRVAQGRLEGWDPASPGELFFLFGDWIAYAIVTPFIFAITARWPVVRPDLARRVAIHLGFALLFCVVWAVVGKVLQAGLFWFFARDQLREAIAQAGTNLVATLARNVASWILTTIPFGVVVYTTVAGLAHAINYFSEARDRELQLARLSQQLSTARFSALQAQLNPHFMFNTLNTIAVLVRDGDRGGAVKVIEHLSDLLRRTLSRHRETEVGLDEELDLVAQYVAIEEARFPDRLRVTIDVPDDTRNASVPAFAVQHLVENAIRHGVARREEAGRVVLSARRVDDALEVRVEDDGPGPGAWRSVTGHGVANTRERLQALYGVAASLELAPAAGTGTVATLRVPWHEHPGTNAHMDSRGTHDQ